MRPQILHDYIIYPTLAKMGEAYNTPAARQLLLATAAQESHCGSYIKQVRGPALGIYQMEPVTIDDLNENYISYKEDLRRTLSSFVSDAEAECGQILAPVGNLFFSTALARANYRRVRAPLPEFDDFDAMWAYYKKYWNSHLGAATKEEFQRNWDKFVAGIDFSGSVTESLKVQNTVEVQKEVQKVKV